MGDIPRYQLFGVLVASEEIHGDEGAGSGMSRNWTDGADRRVEYYSHILLRLMFSNRHSADVARACRSLTGVRARRMRRLAAGMAFRAGLRL